MTSPVSDHMRTTIGARLADIAQQENVLILLAIESGSRAWGFHSPDSDYDVRFIYAEPVSWHLRLGKKSDVIERPIDDELDLSGWSLSKTLGLMMNGNAVTAEWLQSPIVYDETADARDALLDFAGAALSRRPVTWHYSRLLANQFARTVDPGGGLRLKKFFYALRPALALRWTRLHDAAVAPMDMTALRAGCDLPSEMSAQIDELLLAKMAAREQATTAQTYPLLDQLIREELELAEKWLATPAAEGAKNDLLDRASTLHDAFCRKAGA